MKCTSNIQTMGQHMKNPMTKHDVPETNYNDQLIFTKMNSTGHHNISCEDCF